VSEQRRVQVRSGSIREHGLAPMKMGGGGDQVREGVCEWD